MNDGRASSKNALRERIVNAAFSAFLEKGYAGANTREIAARAKVSKRELYAVFENKQEILSAAIASRAQRMLSPLDLPAVRTRQAMVAALREYGCAFIREMSDPHVVSMFRLAVMEAERSPQVAKVLNAGGREAMRTALIDFLAGAQDAGLLGPADPSTMAGQFFSLLWGDYTLRLLLRVARPPSAQEVERRAHAAIEGLLALNGARARP